LSILCDQIEGHAEQVCMAYTHLQPAEVTTVGYRLALYAQDIHEAHRQLAAVRDNVRGKGLKGAVGTRASYGELLEGTGMSPAELEARVMATLGLPAYPIAAQTYPRAQDYTVLAALAALGLALHKMALDIRLLQAFGEWAEPFGAAQVGSSAMPFKRNPINSENIDSLARHLAALPAVAWENAAQSALERTLDDSANRRLILPEAFLAADEITRRAARILRNLRINPAGIAANVARFGVFAATERVLMAAARAGGDRQRLHAVIRDHSLTAWAALSAGHPNPLPDLLAADPYIAALLDPAHIRALLAADAYVGDAPARARALAAAFRSPSPA
jgi:adenylosuccinate lyase